MQWVDPEQRLKQSQSRCLERLEWAVQQLGGTVDRTAALEPIAELIIHTMTGPWRYFHTPEHIFEVGDSGDAIEVLAALFHDLVYVQVDQGMSVNISRFIAAFVKEVDGQLVIREKTEISEAPNFPMFEMVEQVFGFFEGQALLPFAGQNEFLSAVIAAKSLEAVLPPSVIAQIVVCIEATIPFRPTSAVGGSPSDRRYERLTGVNATFGFGWTEAELLEMIRRSVRLANRDVENFAYPSSADFLDNTWNLLPETNHDLKNANSYTVHGYRQSLQKMERFMQVLQPETVFQQFRDEPSPEHYLQLIASTQKNLEVARLYLGSKLLSIAVIEALARRIGPDIPLATMMGELPFLGRSVAQLENFLPQVEMGTPPSTPLEMEVLDLLEKGRSQSSSYDIKNSPVATYLIKSIGFAEARRLLESVKAFCEGTLDAETFLDRCDPSVVRTITAGVLQVFENRKVAMAQGLGSPVIV
jgi:hypothetical protein